MFCFIKSMKNNKKIVLKVNMKKLTLKIAELISNKCDWYDISDFKRIHSLYFRSATETHQEPHQGLFWAIFWQKRTKQWFSRPDLKIWRAGNTTNLISRLEICRNFQLIHHWWTTSYFRKRKLLEIVIIKAHFLGTFILKIITYDFWIYRSPMLKSCSGLGDTISF